MTNGYDNESGMNTKGLNGQGKLVADVANHAVLVLLARIMAVAGPSVAIWLFLQMWGDIQDIKTLSQANYSAISTMEVRVTNNSAEINRLRDQ